MVPGLILDDCEANTLKEANLCFIICYQRRHQIEIMSSRQCRLIIRLSIVSWNSKISIIISIQWVDKPQWPACSSDCWINLIMAAYDKLYHSNLSDHYTTQLSIGKLWYDDDGLELFLRICYNIGMSMTWFFPYIFPVSSFWII